MRRYLTGLLLSVAMTSQAAAFPKVLVNAPSAMACRYLLSSRILTYSMLKHEPIEMTKLPQCITLPRGTQVLAEDSDGGAFIGITLPNSADSKSIWWTYQGWFVEATY